MAEEGLKTKAYCNSCGRETHHIPLHKHEETIEEKEDNFIRPREECWELLKCCGCDEIRVRQVLKYIDSGQSQVRYYPPVETRRLPRWSYELPKRIKELQDEVYSVINGDNRRLAAMGARALIDMAICEKVGDRGTFKDKLDIMEREKYLNSKQRGILETALDAGSAASHRGHNPAPDDITKVMEIVEHLLQQLFYLPKLGEELKQTVPCRTIMEKRGK